MRYGKIPSDNHVLRYAAYNRLQRDPETDIPIRLLPQAFSLKAADEGNLSVTWIEYFEGEKSVQLIHAVQTYRKSMQTAMTSRNKGAFGKAKVATIAEAFRDHIEAAKVRVLHDPTDENPAHAVVTNFQDGFADLLDLLASTVFGDLVLNREIPD